MTYFKEALSAPALHFKRLRLAVPLLCNGCTIVRRTHSAIETEIRWEGRHFMLYIPFRAESIHHIKELEAIANERSRGPLLENHIFYEEFTMVNSLGKSRKIDVILQEAPSGLTLKDAVNHYRAEDLRAAVQKMKSRLDAIGFCHNNLTPSNIIIGNNGVAYPQRYWYAEWEVYSDNDISQAVEYIRSHYNHDVDSLRKPLFVNKDAECATTPTTSEDITRICRCGRYGFVDSDGLQITPFIYSWASDFCEGRAVVAQNGKMGVINNYGRTIVSKIYETIEFDLESGTFTATRNQYKYLIDYEGKIIQRSEKDRE